MRDLSQPRTWDWRLEAFYNVDNIHGWILLSSAIVLISSVILGANLISMVIVSLSLMIVAFIIFSIIRSTIIKRWVIEIEDKIKDYIRDTLIWGPGEYSDRLERLIIVAESNLSSIDERIEAIHQIGKIRSAESARYIRRMFDYHISGVTYPDLDAVNIDYSDYSYGGPISNGLSYRVFKHEDLDNIRKEVSSRQEHILIREAAQNIGLDFFDSLDSTKIIWESVDIYDLYSSEDYRRHELYKAALSYDNNYWAEKRRAINDLRNWVD